jgi:hypothetical protein
VVTGCGAGGLAAVLHMLQSAADVDIWLIERGVAQANATHANRDPLLWAKVAKESCRPSSFNKLYSEQRVHHLQGSGISLNHAPFHQPCIPVGCAAKEMQNSHHNVALAVSSRNESSTCADPKCVSDDISFQAPHTGHAAESRPTTAEERVAVLPSLTRPQRNLFGRSLIYPQGSGFGGSLNVHACIWTAGHRRVFDDFWPHNWSSGVMHE